LIQIKSPREIEEMWRVNEIVATILGAVRKAVKPGVTTADLEAVANEEIRRLDVVAAFKGVKNPQGRPYPAALCTSVNDEIVHGVPSAKKMLSEGDLLSVDFGVYHKGFYGDAAFSVAVGEASKEVHALIETAERSLAAGIEVARVGNRLGDLGSAVQEVVEQAGYHVVREFVGHGIGRDLHEEPQVPNYGKAGTGLKLREGMVLAIEPMINAGGPGIRVDADGWTARTRDGSLAAHVEHSVAITAAGPVILSRVR
jgi:methionyl aminopeptidase